MKKLTFPLLLATALVAASCTNEDNIGDIERNPDNMIAFSSENSSMSRSGFTGADTKISLLFSSQNGTASEYKSCTTFATGRKDATASAESYSSVDFETANRRYWDDCFGRDAKLSVYAFAVPNKENVTLPITSASAFAAGEGTTSYTIGVPQNQSEKDVAELDLTYSNNIQTTSWANKGVYLYKWESPAGYVLKTPEQYGTDSEGRLQFQAKGGDTEAGKFNQGHLIFKHAMCWVTINLKEGTGTSDGFDNTSTEDFVLTGTNNATLNANYTGTFNVAAGTWTSPTDGAIAGLKDNSVTKTAITTHKLEAMTLPDKVLGGVTTDFLTFEIDNNLYHVSCDEIAEAIKAKAASMDDGDLKTRLTSFTTMTAGDHYTINITVKKTAIETITAEVVQWENVEADYTANNARIQFTLRDDAKETNLTETDKFAIYRSADFDENVTDDRVAYNWNTSAYEKATSLTYDGGYFKTNWYWESNKEYYHLRTVTPATTSLETGNKSFAITSGAQDDAHDYQWGAPYYANDSKKLYYDVADGYTYYQGTKEDANRQLFKAIGPTNSNIHLLLQHMMSDVNIVLKTTTGSDAVNITGATVELIYFAADGSVNMGNGLVTPTATITNTATMTANGSTYTYRVVPQTLARTSGEHQKVGIKITTSDHNQYYLVEDLAALKVKSITDNGNNRYAVDNTIDQWYPGYSYTYNITIKKTGIETVTAEIVNWESITADKEVTLE